MRFNLEEEIKNFDFPSKEQMVEELQAKNLGFDFEHKQTHTINIRTNEDKVKQYYIADKLSKNLGDISQVQRLPYTDMWTYSFPCTDLSVAGKGEGMVNKCECGYSWPIDFSDSNETLICPKCGKTVSRSTRSGLLGQVQRLLTIAKDEGTSPKYLLLENVKNLVGKKFRPQFDAWVNWLDSIGYSTYYKVLNAKKYGIAQNRERIFAISIRKDINSGFTFPEEIPLATRLKDILEKNVDEKYYLPDDRIDKILNTPLLKKKSNDDINIVGNYMPSGHDASRVVDIDGVAPTVKENHGTVTAIAEPQIIKVDVPQIVKVRTYEVDTDKLSVTLKDAKKVIGVTNKDIAEQLNQPLTLVEHWFRSDECFSIPDPSIWYDLKSLLKITTDEFDESIMTFEERLGVFEKSNRCYHQDGIAPTLTCIEGEKVIVDSEPFIVASRGRNPENPSDRTTGAPTEQRLEPNFSGCTNTLTSVQKDNYVVEPIIYDDYNSRIPQDQDAITTLTTNCGAAAPRNGVKIIEPVVCEERKDEGLRFFKDEVVGTLRTIDACGDKRVLEPNIDPIRLGNIYGEQFGTGYAGNVWDKEAISPTIMTMQGGNRQPMVIDDIKWRIRKLTPKECWRLMGFTDEDNERASQYVSASAQYKQAGNSICTSCLVAIFSSLLLENGYKTDVWSKYLVDFNE